MEFPAGTYKNFPMVDLGTRTGLEFVGHGKGNHGQYIGKLDGSSTRLIGGGFRGVIAHFTFEKLIFSNQIIHIDSGPSIGSGNGGWDKCSFINCEIIFGNKNYNRNGADCWFRDCVFIRSTVRNSTSQNINYTFDHCQINTCGPAFFQCDGGGNIHFDDIYVLDTGTLVQVTGNGAVFGGQNSLVTFRRVTYDQKHSDFELPDGTIGKRRDILVDDVNNHYGENRRVIADSIVFSPQYPGLVLHYTTKTEWVYTITNAFNLYTPVPEPMSTTSGRW